jgi:autotransporter family porin
MQVNGLDWSLATAPTQPVDGVVEAGTLIWNTSAANGAGVNLATVTVDSGATLQVGAGGTAGAIFVDAAVNGTLAFNRSNAYLFTRRCPAPVASCSEAAARSP